MMRAHVLLARCTLAVALAAQLGCEPWPRDTRGTTEEVLDGGVLYAGMAQNPPWTDMVAGRAVGIEVELVEAFADTLDVAVRWSTMTETQLADALAQGQIHLAVGGFHARSPLARAIRFTRPYVSYRGQKHVWGVPHGESRWLVLIEEFLHERGDEVRRALHTAARREVRP